MCNFHKFIATYIFAQLHEPKIYNKLQYENTDQRFNKLIWQSILLEHKVGMYI